MLIINYIFYIILSVSLGTIIENPLHTWQYWICMLCGMCLSITSYIRAKIED